MAHHHAAHQHDADSDRRAGSRRADTQPDSAPLEAEEAAATPEMHLPPIPVGRASRPEDIMALQRAAGNRAVERHLRQGRAVSPRQRTGPSPPPAPTRAPTTVQRVPRRDASPSLADRIQAMVTSHDTSRLSATILGASENALYALHTERRFLNSVQEGLRDSEFGQLAAAILLKYSYAPGARTEAMRVLSIQFGNKPTARRMVNDGTRVIIVPRNRKMTDLAEFRSLAGTRTFDGRLWDDARGVGEVVVGRHHYAAITEENLLGGVPTYPGAIRSPYAEGYSTTTHEVAHLMHRVALSSADRRTITNKYNDKKRATASGNALFENRWVDGPRVRPAAPSGWTSPDPARRDWRAYIQGLTDAQRRRYECYASQTEEEYFAQLTNAYLGTNTGTDATTGQRRNNGRQWIHSNEPREILELLDRLYGRRSVNETTATGALRPGGARTNPVR